MGVESVSAPRLSVVAALVGATVTSGVLLTPYLAFGLQNPSGHVALSTADACVALLVAFLLRGTFIRSRRLQDLLLVYGLILMAVASLGPTLGVGAIGGTPRGTLDVWLPLSLRISGCLLLTAAALTDDRTVRSRPWHRWWWAPAVAAVVLIAATLWTLRSHLPLAIDLSAVPADAQSPVLTGHPVLVGAQWLLAVCFAAAAVLFTGQAARKQSPLLRWVGPAFVLHCFARINYALYPSLYTDWLYTGDVLRTGAYLVLLLGAVSEIRHYWENQAGLAVLEDRRRVARELHDGVIQELAYIRSEARGLPSELLARGHIVGSCERALDEAREALFMLASPADDRLRPALERAVGLVGQRTGANVDLDVADVPVTPDQRHALVRIAREAVSNATRHGRARSILVRVTTDAGQGSLCVRDDGDGFDPSAPRCAAAGYGLVSMKDRALGLPGSFEIESAPGAGATVRVRWELIR